MADDIKPSDIPDIIHRAMQTAQYMSDQWSQLGDEARQPAVQTTAQLSELLDIQRIIDDRLTMWKTAAQQFDWITPADVKHTVKMARIRELGKQALKDEELRAEEDWTNDYQRQVIPDAPLHTAILPNRCTNERQREILDIRRRIFDTELRLANRIKWLRIALDRHYDLYGEMFAIDTFTNEELGYLADDAAAAAAKATQRLP